MRELVLKEWEENRSRLLVLGATVLVCILPLFLNLLGVDFASTAHPLSPDEFSALNEGQRTDAMFGRLAGAFTHSLLEWGAFMMALFVVVLAFTHYWINDDVVLPIIGVALFWAGCMDAFHALAATRLINATASNTDLIPFTWAICRLFNASIPIIAVGLLYFYPPRNKKGGKFIIVASTSFLLGIGAYTIIHICATSLELPQTIFKNSLITRPWDILPLIIFFISGAVIYPKFIAKTNSSFAHFMWISVIPNSAVQLHMAFGSTALFDNHFNIAHFLKIISYLVPCIGLLLDYKRTYESLAFESAGRNQANKLLHKRNQELQEFTSIASHDLQEPLRKLTVFSKLLKKDMPETLPRRAKKDLDFISDAANGMQVLVQALLSLSKATRKEMKMTTVDLKACVENALIALQMKIDEKHVAVKYDNLPKVWGDSGMITQVYQNLIGNALKFSGRDHPEIELTASKKEGDLILGVKDDGIGINPQYAEQIFSPFKRLHSRSQYEGTGIGLSICRKVLDRHDGKIWVESAEGKGAHFQFYFPAKHKN